MPTSSDPSNEPEPEPEIAVARPWNVVEPLTNSPNEIRIAVSSKQLVKHIVLKYQYRTITEDLGVWDFFGTNHRLRNWRLARRGKVASLNNELGTLESVSELCQHLSHSAIVLYFNWTEEEF